MAKGSLAKELAQGFEALRRETKELNKVLVNSIAKSVEEERKRPFVLVIIDPARHQFRKELVNGNLTGGLNAASLLFKAVSDELEANHHEISNTHYDLVVRLFVCLADIVGDASTPEHRSAQSIFIKGFTKASVFHDWVITGAAISVPGKVCENLHLYMGNDECKHVFFAASGAPKYAEALSRYRKATHKLTIVNGLNTSAVVQKQGVRIVSFPQVFASRPDAPAPMYSKPQSIKTVNSTQVNTANAPVIHKTAVAVTNDSVAIHDSRHNNPAVPSFLHLPKYPIEGRVPINLAKHRLDVLFQLPTPEDLQSYKECMRIQEPCIEFHLQGKCNITECKLSHGVITSGTYSILACKALGKPCSKGGQCRAGNCFNAHFCQQEHCAEAGGRVRGCGLPDAMHNIDPRVAQWVPMDVSE
ncbi:hypothetical protein A1F94_003562 [Pyrenophora tritici-repentis]|uniref:Uncharacterized protein n=2 Tax=Pyrenophora tritici-repentis TaxID=45151 RepID=A0A2W1F1F6_9PLEO|nr:uncharacterized protein PTRG_02479 [Pyrenophora tritici-repentis Pt-1C-BFP]KAF7574402.1 hypothetical protein PtrM4_060250 [Pyrenophora tritici-repentis]EDU45002.1 predicted protein [Pyrenophora tritici-repentis Pt-1C-BFP]KAG9386812.1 hypothetical protein A1F94_003562 [Pyrenophora tritici-repentis]KAI0587750.1 hypothetical protein Alg215_01332 [Pyrenophora tritici-repentis]KAI0589158.1 hypothetical protein Alg130_03050 [Pyrenophora tritici-repentis]